MIIRSTMDKLPPKPLDDDKESWSLPSNGALWCIPRVKEEFIIPRAAKRLTLCVSDTPVRGAIKDNEPYGWVCRALKISYDRSKGLYRYRPVWWWVEWE